MLKIKGVNNFHYIQNQEQDEIYGIFYQNQRMRDLFKTYGNVLFIDGTYKLNKVNYPCVVFVVTDHNRESRVVGFALIAFERQLIVDVVLDYFKQLNDTSHLKAVMIDKDLKEDSAISKAFPDARILNCFWHNEKTFKKVFTNKLTFECVKTMMLTEDEDEFNNKLLEFKRLEANNKKNLEYFESNWLNCIDKWAKFKRAGLPLNLQETNNPVEVINKQFKASSDRHASSSLGKCFVSIMEFVSSSEDLRGE